MANTQVLIQEQGRGYIGHALDYDAAGKGFMAVANADPANANITPVKIYRAERGQPFGTTPIGVMIPNLKVDTGCVAITHTGNNLVVSVSTHAPGEAPRATMVETYVVAGVWTTTAGFEAERGGAGGFTGSEQNPDPGGGGVTEEQLRAILRDELGLRDGENDLIGQFAGAAPPGSSTIRKGLHETNIGDTKTGMVQLMTVHDAQGTQYQDALFDFTKNASANPWKNVLGGEDAWGQARQDELRAIIREEVEAVIGAQAKAPAPKKEEKPPVGSGPKE